MSGSPNGDDRLVEFDKLNWLGKAVFIGGQAARVVEAVVDVVVDRTATLMSGVLSDAERAFRQGIDPPVDEAKILEEHEREGKPPRAPKN